MFHISNRRLHQISSKNCSTVVPFKNCIFSHSPFKWTVIILKVVSFQKIIYWRDCTDFSDVYILRSQHLLHNSFESIALCLLFSVLPESCAAGQPLFLYIETFFPGTKNVLLLCVFLLTEDQCSHACVAMFYQKVDKEWCQMQ